MEILNETADRKPCLQEVLAASLVLLLWQTEQIS